jgi:hypothetical protein
MDSRYSFVKIHRGKKKSAEIVFRLLTHAINAMTIGHTKFFVVLVGLTGISLVRIYAICVVASGPEAQVVQAIHVGREQIGLKMKIWHSNSNALFDRSKKPKGSSQEPRPRIPLVTTTCQTSR